MSENDVSEIAATVAEKWQAPELRIIDVSERTLADPGGLNSDGFSFDS
ncbi:hypothetical protein [Polynucleobacter sp. es-EL-1]|nr:hypothetical protein [Polynucleobacter sp. es-EL-1]QWE11336.1 hypothetical protein FD974_04220 [Polynucleobacter sp. es-EL-1]